MYARRIMGGVWLLVVSAWGFAQDAGELEILKQQVRRQIEFDTLWVEGEIVWEDLQLGTTDRRITRFARQGNNSYLAFVDDNPESVQRYMPPQANAGRKAERFTLEIVDVDGVVRQRSHTDWIGQTQPGVSGLEREAAYGFVYGFWPTPDTAMGLFGSAARDQLSHTRGIRLLELLDAPGPWRITRLDGAVVLSH